MSRSKYFCVTADVRSLQIFAVGPFLKECTTLIYFTVPVEGNIYNYNLCKCTTELDRRNKSVEYKPLLNARLCGYLKSGAKVRTVIHTKTERTLCKTLSEIRHELDLGGSMFRLHFSLIQAKTDLICVQLFSKLNKSLD